MPSLAHAPSLVQVRRPWTSASMGVDSASLRFFEVLPGPLQIAPLPVPWLACPPLRPASAASSGCCEKLRFSSGTLCPPLRPAVAASSRFCEKLRLAPGTLCPPLRPASAARRRFCEKLRFSSGTAFPPMLAICRCRSAFMEAKPRCDTRPSFTAPSAITALLLVRLTRGYVGRAAEWMNRYDTTVGSPEGRITPSGDGEHQANLTLAVSARLRCNPLWASQGVRRSITRPTTPSRPTW